MQHWKQWRRFTLACVAAAGVVAATVPTQAQDMSVYKVKFETSKGDVVIEVHPEWAPLGAARFKELVESGFYDDARFFRVIGGFMAQFGLAADPAVTAQWREKRLKDEPVKQSNVRGMVTFAHAGPNTRTTQLFINYGNNARLDQMGFPAFGKVVEGLDVVDKITDKYGERPDQGRITREGNKYLKESFPELDYIKKATVLKAE